MVKPVKIEVLVDPSDGVAGFDKVGAAAVDAARDFGKAEDAAKRTSRSMDGAADAAGDTASASSQVAGAFGDIGGSLATMGFISEGTASQMDMIGQSIMGVTGVADLAEVAMGKLKIGTIATAISQKAAAAGSKAWAAAQWVLNAALSANPIGLLVVGLAAAVVAITIAYKRSERFRAIVNAAFTSIRKVVANVLPAVRKIVTAVFGGIKIYFTTVFRVYRALFVAAWTAVKTVTRGALAGVKTLVVKPMTAIVDFIRGIPGKITALGSRFKAAGTAIMKRIVDGIKTAAGFIGDVASGIWRAVGTMINQAIDRINNALEFTIKIGPKHFTINPPDIPHVALAKGGIVTRPTLALIGEAGPEAVIPLNDRYNPAGDGEIHVHVHLTAEQLTALERGRRIESDRRAYLGGH